MQCEFTFIYSFFLQLSNLQHFNYLPVLTCRRALFGSCREHWLPQKRGKNARLQMPFKQQKYKKL